MNELVALRLPTGPGLAAAVAAAWARGDAVLPLPAGAPEPAIARLLAATKPGALVSGGGRTALPGGIPVAAGVAAVVTTSGSTGTPKGVELTHAALGAAAESSARRLGSDPGDRWLCCVPLDRIAGLAILVRSRLLGRPPVVHARFDPAAIAAERDVSLISVVPTMLARLLDVGVDLGRFRVVLVGGAACPPDLLARARDAGAKVVRTYGMTETCGGCVYDGEPLDVTEVAIDADGLIALGGPMVMRGYRLDGPLTASVTPRPGWFQTSDLGRWAPDGRLQALGRADDVIVTGGKKVVPREVAKELLQHPGVAGVRVIGIPDDDWGQRVVAIVVSRETIDADLLRAFLRARLEPYKVPKEFRFRTPPEY